MNGLPDVLPVPTGYGKTEGAVLAWAWRSLVLTTAGEPLHLIYCLPMRSLVSQTVERLKRYFGNIKEKGFPEIPVYQLMGGALDEEWTEKPDAPWVLIGTQDQLLSRALNRGYSMSRYAWPVHFGLLNQDCRWIIDEVQLMGPGLWTTAQLDWMRRKRFHALKPCLTTWMSATLEPSFLRTVDRVRDGCGTVLKPDLKFSDLPLRKRREAIRPIRWSPKNDLREIAALVDTEHVPGTLSLVVCNTVDAARALFLSLPENSPKILLTSRFRQSDRKNNEERLLKFEQRRRQFEGPIPDDPGLICVSTQVVEAGLDISAHRLWSEVAPWPSVIQRLGRLNRDGTARDARAWFWVTESGEQRHKGKKKENRKNKGESAEKRIGPYLAGDIETARQLLDALIPLSSRPFAEALETLDHLQHDLIGKALKLRPAPMPRALDVHGLFATEPDVHGGFTDVSAFVRSSDPDADVTVFWRDWSPGADPPSRREDLEGPDIDLSLEGCPVPVYRLAEFLTSQKAHAWGWNEERERWERVETAELRPGMVVMLHRQTGGYTPELGWTGSREHQLASAPPPGRWRALCDDARSELGVWVPLSSHLEDAKRHAEEICDRLRLAEPYRSAVIHAAALHDIGKSHPQWQNALPAAAQVPERPWAKCPKVLAVDMAIAAQEVCDFLRALLPDGLELAPEERSNGRQKLTRLRWAIGRTLTTQELEQIRAINGVRWAGYVSFRPGLRHEAASALAMWHAYRDQRAPYPALSVYLVAAHHGKVRTVFRSLTDTGEDAMGVPREPASISVDGTDWPMDFTIAKDGAEGIWDHGGFLLTGAGWTGLVSDLLGPWRPDDRSHAGVVPECEPRCLGPFVLAYLEALVRAADWRASACPSRFFSPGELAHEPDHA